MVSDWDQSWSLGADTGLVSVSDWDRCLVCLSGNSRDLIGLGSVSGSVLALCCRLGLVSGLEIRIGLRIVWSGSVNVLRIGFCFCDPFLDQPCIVGRDQ